MPGHFHWEFFALRFYLMAVYPKCAFDAKSRIGPRPYLMRTELSVREDVLSRADKLRLAHAPPPPTHPNTTWTLEEKDERGTRQNINQEHRLDPPHSTLLRNTNKVKSLSLISN